MTENAPNKLEEMADWETLALHSTITMLLDGRPRVWDEDVADVLRAAGADDHIEPRLVPKVIAWAFARMTGGFNRMVDGRHTPIFVHHGHRRRRCQYICCAAGGAWDPETAQRAEREMATAVGLNPEFPAAASAASAILARVTLVAPALPPDSADVVPLPDLPPETLSRGGAGGRPMVHAARPRRHRGHGGYAGAPVRGDGVVSYNDAGPADDVVHADHIVVPPVNAGGRFRSLQGRKSPLRGLGKEEMQ